MLAWPGGGTIVVISISVMTWYMTCLVGRGRGEGGRGERVRERDD